MDPETLNLINKYREYNPEYDRYTDQEITQLGLPGFEQPMGINTIPNQFSYRNQFMTDLKNLPSDFRTSLGQTKDALVEDFGQLREGLGSITNRGMDLFGLAKDKGIDLGKMIGQGIGNAIFPGLGFLIGSIKETPQQKAMKEFYGNEFGLDDIGRIQSGIMKGYNPVYGSGGAGLQKAIDKRLATILKTEERKKAKGLGLSQDLINRRKELEALKERDRIAKANIAATPGFDVSGGAGGNYDRSFDYGANTREAQDRRSSDLGFSDIRLKENIELIGKSPSNINIYKFNYKDNPTTYQGVMAHEVPWANVKHSNGYMMVDYNKVDVKFKKWQR